MTQPIMYEKIKNRKSVPDSYAEMLMKEGILSEKQKSEWLSEHTAEFMEEMNKAKDQKPRAEHLTGNWSGIIQAPDSVQIWDTGFSVELLRFLGAKSVQIPESMEVHSHLKKVHCHARLKKLNEGKSVDWATAEALAIGSLLYQEIALAFPNFPKFPNVGYPVRLSGQDVGRGTFSHRHAMLVDQKTDKIYIPLNELHENQTAFLEVANNLLSEEAILGFEYGFSIENPRRLCIWEAQFGDFFNGAQIIIDNFITSGESKWLRQSGLVLLLPHGLDGAGPEHSSCRMERFLQACDSHETQNPADGVDRNIQVVNPTTSAQYFHLLRRQLVRPFQKPLIVVAPKVLLRHSNSASILDAFAPNTHFHPVIDDVNCSVKSVKKVLIAMIWIHIIYGHFLVIFVSGKHAFVLMNERKERNLDEFAIIRLESLCPFPLEELRQIVAKYLNAKTFIWSQEEPRNAGAWPFAQSRFRNGLSISLHYAGRPELAWSATAIGQFHQEEHEKVIKDTFSI